MQNGQLTRNCCTAHRGEQEVLRCGSGQNNLQLPRGLRRTRHVHSHDHHQKHCTAGGHRGKTKEIGRPLRALLQQWNRKHVRIERNQFTLLTQLRTLQLV